ncbi:MAG: RNA polymerase factor sigma-32 [Deltaproteobacteria bacterium]|nr:RNA polymerase factor sigma-32 [Deltaproteobacteria bacterium]
MPVNFPTTTGTLEAYFTEINRFPLLTPQEEFELAVSFKRDSDMLAAEKLVVSNLRFVVKIAMEYDSHGMKLADLIQEGNIGLMHAVKKFDPYKGYRLISYAVWWIRAYIQNFIIKTWSLVKIGTTQTQRKLFFKLNDARRQLEAIAQKNPEFAEIAEKFGVKESEIAEMSGRLGMRDLSLNTVVGDDDSAEHIDFLAYEGDNQETILIRKEEIGLVKDGIGEALEKLTEKERYIIVNRVMADEPETLQEIGDRYGITRERTRQLEQQALKKLSIALPYLDQERKLLTQ